MTFSKIHFPRVRWLVWHRWLGLLSCVGILMWGLSGLCHPIMTRLQPAPVQFTPPPQHFDLSQGMSPRQVLLKHGISSMVRVSVVSLDGKTCFRVVTDPGLPARYFQASEGAELASADQRYAAALASYYTGIDATKITHSEFITAYNDDYPFVNRFLPVWRIEFDEPNHLRAFIDTDQARLATLSNDTRYRLTRLFSFGHHWSVLDGSPKLQIGIMLLVLLSMFTSASSGLLLYYRQRRMAKQRLAQQSVRHWHRRLGLTVALSTLLFTASGSFHLIMGYLQSQQSLPVVTDTQVKSESLTDAAWQQLSQQPPVSVTLLTQNGQPLWLVNRDQQQSQAQVAMLSEEHHHHMQMSEAAISPVQLINATADTLPNPPTDILQLSQQQAAQLAQKPMESITDTTLITQFSGEYGFVFKRLPVVRVTFQGEGHPRYYLEPATGALGAYVTDRDAMEGWSFAYLHKWEFANYNKDFRDILVALFVLGNLCIALLGIWLFTRR